MSSKQNENYPHRCRTGTCRGRLALPRASYGTWAHWDPVTMGWYPAPTCPACLQRRENFIGTAGAGNAYSRYASVYICSECGLKEAFRGFFWRDRCNPKLVKEHHRKEKVS